MVGNQASNASGLRAVGSCTIRIVRICPEFRELLVEWVQTAKADRQES